MALIECSTCKGSGKVKNPNQQTKDTPSNPKKTWSASDKKPKDSSQNPKKQGAISSGNGPKRTHLDARSKAEQDADFKRRKEESSPRFKKDDPKKKKKK